MFPLRACLNQKSKEICETVYTLNGIDFGIGYQAEKFQTYFNPKLIKPIALYPLLLLMLFIQHFDECFEAVLVIIQRIDTHF